MVSVHSITHNGYTLSWDPPALTNDLLGYEVYHNDVRQNSVPASQTSYSAIGLPAGTQFNVQVRAASGFMNGNFSTPSVVTTLMESMLEGGGRGGG
jgi:hypothetical protein